MIPDWYVLALLSLAAWRTFVLLSRDDILAGLRERLVRRIGHLDNFLACPYCLGFWIALAWFGAWQAWPHALTVAAAAVSVTAIVPLIEMASSGD